MKRALIQSIKVFPYTSGEAINREGFLSSILAAQVSKGEKMTISVTHSDAAEGDFSAVGDDHIIVGGPAEIAVSAGDTVNFDLDLVGCKKFIKFNVSVTGTDAAATYAVAMGDAVEVPV